MLLRLYEVEISRIEFLWIDVAFILSLANSIALLERTTMRGCLWRFKSGIIELRMRFFIPLFREGKWATKPLFKSSSGAKQKECSLMSIPLIRLQTPADETLLNSDSAPETASDLADDSDSNGDATSGNAIEGSKPMTIEGILDEMSYEMGIYSYPYFKRSETGCLLVGYDFKYIRSRAGAIGDWEMAFENEYE
ncbi:hypothetical protein Syun_031967 [Stephania yunnanensis]|uniref:Uncharacterized protein n=1 Tax=Stephania yunnanensis TaxID=152371 RepID=A0AAP0DWD4_9MAGN